MPTPSEQLLSRTIYDVDGTTTVWNFAFSGGYIDPSHVKAYTELPTGVRTPIVVTPEMLIGEFQLQISPALPPSAGVLVIYRDTPKDLPLVDFVEGPLSEVALDTNARQAVFIAAEAQDEFASTNYQIAVDAASAAVASAAQVNIDANTAANAAAAAGSSALVASNAAAAAASSASLTAGAVAAFATDLAQPTGSALVGFQQPGGVARTVEDEIRQFVTPGQFGAVGDGVTDDTVAIQAAIDAATLAGKSVLVNGVTGSYLCGPLSISASLIGENRQTSKLTRKAGTTGAWLNVTANAVSVSGLYIDGAYVAARCIEVDGYDDVVITNNIARQIGEYFVHFNNSDRLVVSANDYKDGSNGIANLMPVDSAAAVVSVDVKITGNHIENIPGTAIHFAGKQSSSNPLFAWTSPLATNGIISGNTIKNVGGNGIIAQSYYLTISNNTIRDTGSSGGNQGIVPQGNYISVVGNVIEGGSGVGIDMGGCDTSTVSGNVVQLQAEIGIELQSCTNTTCVGNSVVDCGFGITGDASAGIAVLQGFFGPSLTSKNNIVSGNTVISNGSSGQYGISVGGGVSECVVTANNIVDSGTVQNLFVSSTAEALVYGNASNANEEDLFVVYGDAPKFAPRSTSGNTDFWMLPQGAGTLRIQKYMGTAATPAAFSAVSYLPIKDQDGNIFYIPLSASIW